MALGKTNCSTENACFQAATADTIIRGLGALVANKFAAEGSNVAINYVSNKETADQVASEIASKYGVKTIVVQGVSPFNRLYFRRQNL